MHADGGSAAEDLVEHRVKITGARPAVDDQHDPHGGGAEPMPPAGRLPLGEQFGQPGEHPAGQLGVGPGGHRGHVRERAEGPQRVAALVEADDLHLGG